MYFTENNWELKTITLSLFSCCVLIDCVSLGQGSLSLWFPGTVPGTVDGINKLFSVNSASGLDNRAVWKVESQSSNLEPRESQILLCVGVSGACESTGFLAPAEFSIQRVWGPGAAVTAGAPLRDSGLPDGLVVLDTCSTLSSDAWPTAEQSVTLMSLIHSPATGGFNVRRM